MNKNTKTVKCPKCNTEYSIDKKACPSCFEPTPLATGSTWLVAILIILVASIAFFEIYNSISAQKTIKPTTTDLTITLSEFNRIETGMTYQEVCQIVGCEGVLASETNVTNNPNLKTQMYHWNGYSSSSGATIMLQRGKVISKSQLGLN